MKNRDLIRLPLGKYKLRDSNRNFKYDLNKYISDYDKTVVYSIGVSNRYNAVLLFEQKVKSTHDDFYHERDFKEYEYIILTGIATVNGISIHSEDISSAVFNLEFDTDDNSYKKWDESLLINSKEPELA